MMQTNTNPAHGDNPAVAPVATALNGVIVRGERNLLAESAGPGLAGARAALETFYFAFNTRSPDLYQQIWADDPLVQVGTPVAGLVRGSATIAAIAVRMLSAPARVQVQTMLEDIVAYVTPELVVFTGREHGSYTGTSIGTATPDSECEHEAMAELPDVRSICIFRYVTEQGGWRQVYHSVSIDDADQLARYQRAVRGT